MSLLVDGSWRGTKFVAVEAERYLRRHEESDSDISSSVFWFSDRKANRRKSECTGFELS